MHWRKLARIFENNYYFPKINVENNFLKAVRSILEKGWAQFFFTFSVDCGNNILGYAHNIRTRVKYEHMRAVSQAVCFRSQRAHQRSDTYWTRWFCIANISLSSYHTNLRTYLPARECAYVCDGALRDPRSFWRPSLCAAPESTWIKGERPGSSANLMRDHLALTVCFSRDQASPERENTRPRTPPETYIFIRAFMVRQPRLWLVSPALLP